MCGLSHYLAGACAVVLAMDFVAPPGGTSFDRLLQSAFSSESPAAGVAVNRTRKGDRLAQPQSVVAPAIAAVEVIGLRDAAIVYRDRDGRVLFQTDPLANATVISRGVSLPEVTVRESMQSVVRSVPVQPPAPNTAPPESGQKPAGREQKVPVGCDPAFSPLAAAKASNFSARCLADASPHQPMGLRLAALP
jgi:hypothetical protein